MLKAKFFKSFDVNAQHPKFPLYSSMYCYIFLVTMNSEFSNIQPTIYRLQTYIYIYIIGESFEGSTNLEAVDTSILRICLHYIIILY